MRFLFHSYLNIYREYIENLHYLIHDIRAQNYTNQIPQLQHHNLLQLSVISQNQESMNKKKSVWLMTTYFNSFVIMVGCQGQFHYGLLNALAFLLTKDLHIPLQNLIFIQIYRQSYIVRHTTANLVIMHNPIKHIDVDNHFLYDLVFMGAVHVKFVPCTAHLAEIFMKGLLTHTFLSKILLIPTNSYW